MSDASSQPNYVPECGAAFIPVVVETLGGWAPGAVRRIGEALGQRVNPSCLPQTTTPFRPSGSRPLAWKRHTMAPSNPSSTTSNRWHHDLSIFTPMLALHHYTYLLLRAIVVVLYRFLIYDHPDNSTAAFAYCMKLLHFTDFCG